MLPADRYVRLARAVEEGGYDSVAVPESVFYAETTSGDYPFTSDGRRWWKPETPFLDPFVAIAAMAAVTERIGFVTSVLKVPLRSPLLLAKQVASLASLSGNRFRLGVGASWMPEEFTWTGTDLDTRGPRLDEAIEIVRAVCSGAGPTWVEHHGEHYDFGPLMISPAPDAPVPILVGGHSKAAMRRATRAEGWISANSTTAELTELLERLHSHLDAAGRPRDGFEVNALAIDAFDIDGFTRLGDLGVTHCQVLPWYFYGGDPDDLGVQLDSLTRFSDEVLRPMSEDTE